MDFLAYLGFRIFVWFVNSLPGRLALLLGSVMGSVAFRAHTKGKELVVNNIMRAFGKEKKEEEARSVALSFYRNMGMGVVEFARLKKIDKGYIEKNVIFEGCAHIDAGLKKGKGVVILTAHFGNWELLNCAMALKGYTMSVVVRPIDNIYMNSFIEGVRTKFGNRMIEKKNALGRITELLRNNGIVGILLDQRAGRKDGIEVDFFGIPAQTSKGLAAVVGRTGSSVIPTFIRREGFSRHRVTFLSPLELSDSGAAAGRIRENTQRFTRAIENFIRKYPEEWFWFHSRWERRKKREGRMALKRARHKWLGLFG